MADTTTIARPYAKAIFEHALAAHTLAQWSVILHDLATAVSDPLAVQFIANPAVTAEQRVALLKALFVTLGPKEIPVLTNLLTLLAYNKRLLALPDIKRLFEVLRSEQEKTLEVKVISFSELSTQQRQQLTKSLSERLQRQVTLNLSLDKSLLGGAIIHADDLIIDGSVRGKLMKLNAELVA